jgi:hypothetical protein
MGLYFSLAYSVAKSPIGSSVTSPRICENSVDDTRHGMRPYLTALSLAFYTASV